MSNDDSQDMKDQILRDYPRMTADDKFNFKCHDKLSCFTHCCADVNIALTPYDVLRLRKRIGMGSEQFIDEHLFLPKMAPGQKLPMVYLRMRDDDKRCKFVGPTGCGVYEDRPWACRMYPVGHATSRTDANPDGEDFYFILRDRKCDGLGEQNEMTIREWMQNQRTGDHDAANEEFKELSLHPFLTKGYALEPQHRQMFFMACYNLDRFREFVFESTFLKKFEIEPETLAAIRENDEELLRFAYRWLRFALFHERTLKINSDYEDAKKKVLRVD